MAALLDYIKSQRDTVIARATTLLAEGSNSAELAYSMTEYQSEAIYLHNSSAELGMIEGSDTTSVFDFMQVFTALGHIPLLVIGRGINGDIIVLDRAELWNKENIADYLSSRDGWAVFPKTGQKQDKPRNKGTGRPARIPQDIWFNGDLRYMIDGKLIYPRDYTRSPHLWHAREEYRLSTDGKYIPLCDAIWQAVAKEFDWRTVSAMRLQFPHCGEHDSEMIAYTENPRKGYADRQVTSRAGKYFGQFTDDQKLIKRLSDCHRTGYMGQDYELKLATKTDEIVEIYTESSIDSCMSYPAGHFDTGGTHPVEAYSEDFACAYIESDDGTVLARAIVTPDDKQFASLYGKADELKAVLEREGYTRNSNFAQDKRLLAIEHNGGYIAPYVDGYQMDCWLQDDHEYIIISDNQPHNTTHIGNSHASHETSGFCGYSGQQCDHCNSRYDDESTGGHDHWGNDLCDNCINQYFVLSDNENGLILQSEAVWCFPEEEWNLQQNATRLSCGVYSGEYTHNDNAQELYDGQKCHTDDIDDNVIELETGAFALCEDTVRTLSGEIQLLENCECLDDSDEYELIGTYYNGLNLRQCDLPELHALWFKGRVSSSTFILSQVTDKPALGFMPFDAVAAITSPNGTAFRLANDHWQRSVNWRVLPEQSEQQQTES